eukprot:g5424.t1
MLLHIQIEMKLPRGYNPEKGEGRVRGGAPGGGGFGAMKYRRRMRCSAGVKRSKIPMDAGLNLARVKMGDDLGPAKKADKVPSGASRATGVACRVTKMFYAVAADGKVTQPRVFRFMEQMSFARRSRALLHGSLVTGKGNWTGKAPIELKPLPTDPVQIMQLIKQWPDYTYGYYLFHFNLGNLRALTSDSSVSMNDGDELEFRRFVLRREGKKLMMKAR